MKTLCCRTYQDLPGFTRTKKNNGYPPLNSLNGIQSNIARITGPTATFGTWQPQQAQSRHYRGCYESQIAKP
jgi:hypothetical protein